jgi:hypothetical protein
VVLRDLGLKKLLRHSLGLNEENHGNLNRNRNPHPVPETQYLPNTNHHTKTWIFNEGKVVLVLN